MKSLRELYRIGLGPSSSHTMAPSRAASMFLDEFSHAAHFDVTLYGSLAATGKGHFTDLAIYRHLPEERTTIKWQPDTVLPQHPNGMRFSAFDAAGKNIGEKLFFSVGGGALSVDGRRENTPELYPYRNMQECMDFCKKEGVPLWQLAELHEGKDIWAYLEMVADTMENAVRRGIEQEGVLPGGLHLARKAHSVFTKTMTLRNEIQRTGLIASGAYAVAEENASSGLIVTAPTCGSCGVLPGVLHFFREEKMFSDKEFLHALATAGIVGNIVKQNGSISGAEVGCQGEIGVACAMASAATAQLFGGSVPQIEYAAEIGLEHFLGLTCDPLLGLVQIPCIERNVLAANRAVIAAELALLTDGCHFISFDTVVQTMLETGHDLPSLYRETSTGGLSKFALKEKKNLNKTDKRRV